MDIKPYRLKLAKVSSNKQRLLDALFSYLPQTGIKDEFIRALQETISLHINVDASFNLDAVAEGSLKSFLNRMPETFLAVVLGTPPREGKILIELDSALAGFFVERLLGSSADTFPPPRPLSEVELGVLQYLILQMLEHIYRLCGATEKVHFIFERFVFKPDDIKNIVNEDEFVFQLTIGVSLAASNGFVRLLFPSLLIEKMYLDITRERVRDAELMYQWGKLDEFKHIKFPLWAEGGKTTIMTHDLKNLEDGDVIVLEETGLKLDEFGLSGRAVLRAGDGRHGGLISELSADTQFIHCKIIDVKKGEDII